MKTGDGSGVKWGSSWRRLGVCSQKFSVRGEGVIEECVAAEVDVNVEQTAIVVIEVKNEQMVHEGVKNDVPETKNEQMVDEGIKKDVPKTKDEQIVDEGVKKDVQETQVETMRDNLIAKVSHFVTQLFFQLYFIRCIFILWS